MKLTQNQIDNLMLRFEAIIGHMELKSRTAYEKELTRALDIIFASFLRSEDMTEFARRRMIAEVITKEMGSLYGNLGNNVIADMGLIVGITNDVYKYAYGSSAAGKALSFNKRTLLYGYELGDLIKSNEVNGVKQFKRIIAQGLAEGKHYRTVSREINNLKKRMFDHTSGIIVGDAMAEARGQARKEVYKQLQKDKDIKGVEWVATLEINTCKICSPLDGRRWKTWAAMIKETHGTKMHPRCRCTQVFITGEETGVKWRAGIDYSSGERKGTSFRDMTYSEWIKLQPKKLQQLVKSRRYVSRKDAIALLKEDIERV